MIKEFNYDLDKQDFRNLSKDLTILKRYKKFRIMYSLLIAIITVFAIVAPLLIFNFLPLNWTIILGMMTLILVFIVEYLKGYSEYLEKKWKNTNKGRDLTDNTIKINSDDEYFCMNNKYGESKLKWNQIKAIYNEKNNILLFIADYQVLFIPKRIFNSEKEINETWNLIFECHNKANQ